MRLRLEKVGLIAAMAIVTLNIWTGAPLAGLWLGSRAAPDSGGISMLAVFVVVASIGALAFALLKLLAVLHATHDRLAGIHATRRQTPWLKPMSGARSRRLGGVAAPLSAAEYAVISGVVLGVAAFEVWFFFYSGSSLPR